jgi:ubiquinone/menaquinone biosynthesis C-methylase UbiE
VRSAPLEEGVTPRYRASLEAARAAWWDAANFEKWKGHYLSEYPRGWSIVDLLRAEIGMDVNGALVLDVGCGDGGVPIAFAEAGAIAHGVEPDERSLERARIRAEEHGVAVDLRAGIAESLPFSDEGFDLVILDNVLEHVGDRDRALEEIRRVLRPGGLLYVVTPKPFSLHAFWSDPHYQMAGLVLMPRPLQVWYFERARGGGVGNYSVGVIPTRRSLLRMLRRTGFRSLVPPRDLWVRYLRERIARPEDVRPGLKRRLARWLATRPETFDNRVLRWLWDVVLGSNIVIARREP